MDMTLFTPNVQNLIYLNFEFFAKVFLLGFIFLFSLYRILISNKNVKPTPYILFGIMRALVSVLCYVFLFFFPMFIFLLFPSIGIDVFLQTMLAFYSISLFIIGFVFMTNLVYFVPLFITKFMGIEYDVARTNKVFKSWFENDWVNYGKKN